MLPGRFYLCITTFLTCARLRECVESSDWNTARVVHIVVSYDDNGLFLPPFSPCVNWRYNEQHTLRGIRRYLCLSPFGCQLLCFCDMMYVCACVSMSVDRRSQHSSVVYNDRGPLPTGFHLQGVVLRYSCVN